jgi:hypothetical protein
LVAESGALSWSEAVRLTVTMDELLSELLREERRLAGAGVYTLTSISVGVPWPLAVGRLCLRLPFP